MQRPTPMIFWQDPVPRLLPVRKTENTEEFLEISIPAWNTVQTKDTSINFINEHFKKNDHNSEKTGVHLFFGYVRLFMICAPTTGALFNANAPWKVCKGSAKEVQ